MSYLSARAPGFCWQHFSLRRLRTALVCGLLIPMATSVSADSLGRWELLTEMTPPPGLERSTVSEMKKLVGSDASQRAVSRLRQQVEADWEHLRKMDVVALSRWHQEETLGYVLPASASSLQGEVLGQSKDSGRISVRVFGPRLPVRFQIVERHVVFYGLYDPVEDRLSNLSASIFHEVFE